MTMRFEDPAADFIPAVVRVFGPPPKPLRQRQNIFVSVFSWTWISRPITGSQFI